MGSSIKINSISIDLAGAANEIDMVKCDHFSIRGFVAETREIDHNKCWPFPEKSVILVDQESYSLPSLSVPKFRWWRCMSCIRDIDAGDDGTKDCELHPNSRSISGEKLDGNSLAILTIQDQKKENKTDIAGNAVVNEDVINCKRSQKDDHRANIVRRKVKKLASQEKVRNKRAKVTDKQNVGRHHAVTTFGSSEIAGLVEDTPPKGIKNQNKDSLVLCDHNGSSESINLAIMSGLQRRKTRKVRRLSELLDQPETKTSTGGDHIRREESSSSKRGRKRKVLLPENNYVSRKLITVAENASKSCDSDYSTSTDDSGFDRDLLIKGKQKNRRFQVVDEFVPSALPFEDSVRKSDADLSKCALSAPVHSKYSVPCPLSGQRTEKKLSISRKKKSKAASDNGKSTLISFSSQQTRDLLNNEKRVGSSFDDRFASEGYFRKPVISLNNDHVIRSRDVEEAKRLGGFGSSSKPNTGGWLRTGVDAAVDFNNKLTDRLSFQSFNLRNTSSTTEVADPSSLFQKDADRKGKTVMFQEHHHVATTKSQSHDRKDQNTHEDQNDDIPMEIVELLAKNQYERCLPDKEDDKQPSQETTQKPKNTLLIDLNETYDNGTSLEDNNNNNTSRPPKPFDSNATRRDEHYVTKSLDFFPIRSQPPFVPSPFGIFPPPPPTQDNRFSGHTCQWLGNVPTMSAQPPYRVLRACNTCQSVPQAASHPLWTTSMRPPPPPPPQCHHHHASVSFNTDPSTKLGMLSQPPPSNENTWNLNFVASNGKQKGGSTSSELSFGCKHGGGVSNSNRPVDAAFTSESSIPALHLLSLMDPRVEPNTKATTTKTHFPHVSQPPKERIEIQTGDSSKTTKQLPYDYYSKGFPIVPVPLGASSFSFQNTQPSWIHHHQEKKTKRKDTTVQPVYTSGNNDQGRFQLLGATDSMKLPLKFHMMDKEKKQKRKAESCSNNASAWLQKNSCGPIVCNVNRNPAEFTIAEPGNVYMLTGDSLKVRKRATDKKKTSVSKQEALKQTKKPVLPVTENA